MTQTTKLTARRRSHKERASPLISSKKILLAFQEVEAWQRDNEFLIGKYRDSSGSYGESLKSLFYLHNQTGNIYSHLAGVVLFLAYAFHVYDGVTTQYSTADTYDIVAFGIFIGSAIICFGFSASFHLFGNHSCKVYHTWLLMDLYGIFVLIAGTVYSGTYYAFYCEPEYWVIYSIGITVIVASAAMLCSIPRFCTPQWRWARALLFCVIGWSGAFPMTHIAQKVGIEQADRQMGWWSFIAGGLSYITGAIIYAFRFPERFYPGLFDIWGSSHQIFHICAVAGAGWHLNGLLKAFHYNHSPDTRVCYL